MLDFVALYLNSSAGRKVIMSLVEVYTDSRGHDKSARYTKRCSIQHTLAYKYHNEINKEAVNCVPILKTGINSG